MAISMLLIMMAGMIFISSMEPADAATSGRTGDCRWSLEGTNLTIYGNGEMGSSSDGELPWGTRITSVVVEYGVTSIGAGSFAECTALRSVELPDSIKTIGAYAFYKCSSLKTIDLPDSVETLEHGIFRNCTSLQSVIFPDSIKSMSTAMVMDCTNLSSASFPSNMDVVPESTFQNCTSLKSIVIPESVRQIDKNAFKGCSSLKTVTFGSSLNEIGRCAFYQCSDLASIIIPASVSMIDYMAFSDCASVTSITFIGKQPVLEQASFSLGVYGWLGKHADATIYSNGWASESVFTEDIIGGDTTLSYEIGYVHTVTYRGNGATSGYMGPTYAIDSNKGLSSVKISPNSYQRTGYTFAGWNTVSNGSGISYSVGGYASVDAGATITMYAQWTKIDTGSKETDDGNNLLIITGLVGILIILGAILLYKKKY